MIPALLMMLWAGAVEIRLGEREDAAMVVLAPFGPTRAGTSNIIAAAAAAFDAETDLRIAPGQELGIDVDRMIACPAATRLSCWTWVAAESKVRLLLIATAVPTPEGDRVAIAVLDLELARKLLDRSDAEDAIFETMLDLPPRELADPAVFFRDLVAEDFRPYLQERKHFRPFGGATIETECEGCSVLVGESVVGVSSAGTMRVSGLRPGATTIALVRGDQTICALPIEVAAGRTVPIDCEETPFDPNIVLLYGGAGALAVGAASIIASFVILSRGPAQACVSRERAACDFATAARSGYGVEGTASPISESNGGLPLLPVGGAFAFAGAGWLAGSLAIDSEWWWLTLAAGAALGVVAGGLLVLAE
jgi:hypothetical protein